MTKILHLFGKLDKGGAELRTIESLKHFKNDYEFAFISLSGEEGGLDKQVKAMGYEVFHIKLKSLFFPVQFIRLLKDKNIDIIHSHIFYSTAIIVILSKLFTKKKIISHFRTSGRGDVNKLKKLRNYFFKKIINNFSDKIIFVSKSTKSKAFEDVNMSKAEIIYNGFGDKENLKLSRFRIVHVGRFNEAKNQLFLIEVARGLENKNSIEFIGKDDTKYGENFKRQISNYRIENIKISGISDNVDRILQESKIFLFPSLREGLPGALIEAALNNCYIIASDIPENREVASFFPDQIKILPLDPDLWINEIKVLINRETSEDFEKVSSFSYEEYIRKMEQLYNSLK